MSYSNLAPLLIFQLSSINITSQSTSNFMSRFINSSQCDRLHGILFGLIGIYPRSMHHCSAAPNFASLTYLLTLLMAPLMYILLPTAGSSLFAIIYLFMIIFFVKVAAYCTATLLIQLVWKVIITFSLLNRQLLN